MSAPRFKNATPVLLVRDVVKAAGYYTDKLGFQSDRFWGEPPAFAIVYRDGVSLMLNQVGLDDDFRPNGSYDGRFSAYLDVDDADGLHAEFQSKSADIVCEPEDQIYQMREFQVRDLDGHLLGFGQPLSAEGHSE